MREEEAGRNELGLGYLLVSLPAPKLLSCSGFGQEQFSHNLTHHTHLLLSLHAGANPVMINRLLDKMGVRDPVDLSEWDEDQVKALVEAFLLVRFPTILLLNKADQVCCI